MSRRQEAGLSLVEVTIILLVLSALTAVVAPSIATYSNDARQVAAKSDVEAIGSAIIQLLRDTGSRCLRLAGANTTLTDCTLTNRVDLLVSAGPLPRAIDLAQAPDITLPDAQSATNATVNWQYVGGANAPTQQDLLEDQFTENDNATPYPAASFAGGGGPRMKLGWRGAYLNGPILADPWNARYQANTMFLTVATNATDAVVPIDQTTEGLRETGWNRDVLVMSAGINGVVETSFGGTATAGVAAGGDDVIYVVSGGSR
jgi:type II secretory pathway pseudopilin PulG